jgi:serine/threonine protein kinase
VKHYAAVKVLTGMSTEAEFFRQEAQTVMGLSHPHIIHVLDFGIEEQTPYLIMDYAPYGSLRSRYRNMVVPIETVLFSARRIAAALQHAHRRRIIHRDVKPENMLMGKGHQILLSDFGIAAMGQGSRTRDVAGTAAYMAPEQIRGKPCPASDQYALAITVYEWLCGRRPFKGTFSEMAAQHLSASPPPLRRYAPSLSPDVEAVILRALEKDPERRFPTVLSFANALRDAAEGDPSRVRFVAGVASNERTGSGTMRRGQELTGLRSSREKANAQTVGDEKPSAMPSRRPIQKPRRFPRRVLLVTSILGAGFGLAFFSPSLQWLVLSSTPGSMPTPTPGSLPKLTPTPTSPPTPTPTPEPAGTLSVYYLGHTDEVFSVAFSPDGTRLASGGADGTAQVWDATTGNRLFTYLEHSGTITSLAWEPSGTRMASAGADKTVQVWDAATGSRLFTYRGHSSTVTSVAWSPDGTRIASGSFDKTIHVWSATTGVPFIYRGHGHAVNGVSWSPDGMRVASASSDHRVEVWYV